MYNYLVVLMDCSKLSFSGVLEYVVGMQLSVVQSKTALYALLEDLGKTPHVGCFVLPLSNTRATSDYVVQKATSSLSSLVPLPSKYSKMENVHGMCLEFCGIKAVTSSSGVRRVEALYLLVGFSGNKRQNHLLSVWKVCA